MFFICSFAPLSQIFSASVNDAIETQWVGDTCWFPAYLFIAASNHSLALITTGMFDWYACICRKKPTTTTATTIILGCAELMMVMSFTTNSEACLRCTVPRPANIFYYTTIIILPMLSLIPFTLHFLTYTSFFFFLKVWYDATLFVSWSWNLFCIQAFLFRDERKR